MKPKVASLKRYTNLTNNKTDQEKKTLIDQEKKREDIKLQNQEMGHYTNLTKIKKVRREYQENNFMPIN